MKVAACKYPIGEPRDFAAFAARQAALLGEAKARGAQLAVLPEYLSLELAAMFDDAIRGDLHASLAAIQPLRDDWLSLYAGLARELGIGIVAAMAYNAERDTNLVRIDVPELFQPNITRLAIRHGVYLRDYAYDFILRLVPGLNAERIAEALRNEVTGHEDFVI